MSCLNKVIEDHRGNFSHHDGGEYIPVDFERKDLANFWKRYCKNKDADVYENPRNFMPIIFSMRIGFDENIEDEDFSEFIENFIGP